MAYDFILSNGVGLSSSSSSTSSSSGGMGTFFANMATGQGHHKQSDGREYELWLDLRGRPETIGDAKREVAQLFWRLRAVVDTMQSGSLVKEGVISAIVIDDTASPQATDEASIGTWDFDWMPLLVADEETGAVRHARTLETFGRIRPAFTSRLLTGEGAEGSSTKPPEVEEDLVISASDARQTDFAKQRYKFAMSSLLLPADPASWAVAATAKAGWRAATDTTARMEREEW